MTMSKENLLNRVKMGLEEVRPYLMSDGGNISLVKVTSDMTVFVRFEGACKTCDVNQTTLKLGVEESIKKHASEINSVKIIE